MSDSAMLLRMLEPAVRPVDAGKAGGSKPAAQPFEQRSFESLLQDAKTQQAGTSPAAEVPGQDAGAGTKVAEATTSAEALGPISGLGTIENATLRQLMANHAAADASKGALNHGS